MERNFGVRFEFIISLGYQDAFELIDNGMPFQVGLISLLCKDNRNYPFFFEYA